LGEVLGEPPFYAAAYEARRLGIPAEAARPAPAAPGRDYGAFRVVTGGRGDDPARVLDVVTACVRRAGDPLDRLRWRGRGGTGGRGRRGRCGVLGGRRRTGDWRGGERSMLLVAEYEEGAIGTLAHSWEIPSTLRGLRLSRIYGTRGSVLFESNGLFVRVTGSRPRLILPGLRDIGGYRAMFRDFLGSIRTGREPLMSLARAQRGLELVEAAYRSVPVVPELEEVS